MRHAGRSPRAAFFIFFYTTLYTVGIISPHAALSAAPRANSSAGISELPFFLGVDDTINTFLFIFRFSLSAFFRKNYRLAFKIARISFLSSTL